jgi:hypothetical protein
MVGNPLSKVLRFTSHAFCSVKRMARPRSSSTRKTLQALFARAAGRRAERRVFVATLRQILERRLKLEPLLVVKLDRRRTPREAQS